MCKKSNKLRKNKCHNRKHRKKYAKRARFKNRKQRRSITGRKPSATPSPSSSSTVRQTEQTSSPTRTRASINPTIVVTPERPTHSTNQSSPATNQSSPATNGSFSHLHCFAKKEKRSHYDQKRLRNTISFLYEYNYHHDYTKGILKLEGNGGVYSQINQHLILKHNHSNTIKNVVKDTQEAIANYELYEPDRKIYTKKNYT